MVSKNGRKARFADQDYWRKLDPDTRKWLSKFNVEYYTGLGLKSAGAIHEPRHHADIYRDCHSSRRDVMSYSPEQLVAKFREMGPPGPQASDYSPSDYPESESLE